MLAPIGDNIHEVSPVGPALALLAIVVDLVALASVLLLSCRERIVNEVVAELVLVLRVITCPQQSSLHGVDVATCLGQYRYDVAGLVMATSVVQIDEHSLLVDQHSLHNDCLFTHWYLE